MSSGTWAGRRIEYGYDLAGNILDSKDSGQEAFPPISYTLDNRICNIGVYPVEMDADGNLLYMSDGQTMASYEYDARNRLIKSGKAQYTYDAQGNRISMTWKGKTTRYVIDNLGELSRVLMELDGEGNPKATYVYGLGLIGREDAQGNYRSYHSDLRGSTTLLTDEQGSVTDRYTYGPYGELEKHEGSTNQPFRYNGRDGVQTDPNGLYYMRARYYDPQLKRFLNRDVLRGDLLDGQTFNRYAYVNGDPINYIDPLGLCKEGSTQGKRLLDRPTAGDNTGSMLRGEGTSNLPSRNGALNQAKRDAGIPKSQNPESVNRVDMRTAEHEGGHVIKDSKGKVISTREYVYTNTNGKKIIIQDHGAGHEKGGQGPHFNVRPIEKPRTGNVTGTQEHYPFKK